MNEIIDRYSNGAVTRWGFEWGPATVERIASVEGRGRVIEIRTDHARVQVRVSEKGRKISVHPLPSPPHEKEVRP